MDFDPSKISEMMQQAQSMQQKLQDDLKTKTATGSAGGGMVLATVNGNMECTGMTIDPNCVDPSDVPLLEDLVRAAVNDALRKMEQTRAQGLQGMMGSMGMPPGMF